MQPSPLALSQFMASLSLLFHINFGETERETTQPLFLEGFELSKDGL